MPPFKAGTAVNFVRRRKGTKKRPCLRITAGPLRGMYVNRLVMAAKLGRPLEPDEEVDHIDQDSLNDWYDNLQLMESTGQHAKITNERTAYAKGEELALLGQWRHWIRRTHEWALYRLTATDNINATHADMLEAAAQAIRSALKARAADYFDTGM